MQQQYPYQRVNVQPNQYGPPPPNQYRQQQPPNQYGPPQPAQQPYPPAPYPPAPSQYVPPPQPPQQPYAPAPYAPAPYVPPAPYAPASYGQPPPYPPAQYGQPPAPPSAPYGPAYNSKSHPRSVFGKAMNALDGPPFGFYINIVVIIIICCIVIWLIYTYACEIPGIDLLCKFWSFMFNILYYIYSGLSWIFNLF